MIRARRLAANLLLTVFALMLSVATLEVGARLVVGSRSIESLRTYDASGIAAHTRNFSGGAWDDESGRRVHLKTNGLGFMGPISSTRADSSAFRIAILGDSFTEAFQVDFNKSFSFLLENRLTAMGRSVEVWNFGFAATGPVEALTIYHEHVRQLQPDLVVLAFFYNDFVDANEYRDLRDVIANGDIETLTAAAAEASPTGWRHTFAAHSRLYEFLSLRLRRSRHHGAVYSNPNALPDHLAQFEPGFPLEEQYAMWLLTFDRLLRDVHRDDEDLLTILLPLKGQVYTESLLNALAAEWPSKISTAFDLGRVDRFLISEFGKREITFLHLLPAFQERRQEEQLYFRGHFNERGHALTATILADHILANYF